MSRAAIADNDLRDQTLNVDGCWEWQRGKNAKGRDNPLRGSLNGNSKLTDGQAAEIYGLRGVESQVKTAARYGVSKSQVGRIQIKQRWGLLNG